MFELEDHSVERVGADDRLVFGPIAQTVAAMSCISLGQSPFPSIDSILITRLNSELAHTEFTLVLIILNND
jgi:hypothetical protein